MVTSVQASLVEEQPFQLKSCLKKGNCSAKTVTFDDNMFVIRFKNTKKREIIAVEESYVSFGRWQTRIVRKKGSRFDYLISLKDEVRIPELWDLERPTICVKGCPKKKTPSVTDNPEIFLEKATYSRMNVTRIMAESDNNTFLVGRIFFDLALAQRAVALYSFGQIGYCNSEQNELYFKQQFKVFLFASLENYVKQAQVASSVEMFHLVGSSFVKNIHAIGHAAEKDDESDYLDATIAEVGRFASFLYVKINDYHSGVNFDCEQNGCPDCQYIVAGIEDFKLAYQ